MRLRIFGQRKQNSLLLRVTRCNVFLQLAMQYFLKINIASCSDMSDEGATCVACDLSKIIPPVLIVKEFILKS